MKVSLNTLQFYKDKYQWSADIAPNGYEDLIEKIGAQLGGIEEVINFGDKYQGVIIVKIVTCEKHPNADKLNICMIDDGGTAQGVERDANGLVQVVCGAPNVRAGLLVAWLPPGTTVPESVGKEPFVLGSRELRGIVSNGMLASARELALGDSHDGILEIGLDADETITPGVMFSDAYHLGGDTVIDIENKMFTHRPDCFGFIGVAREIAGIQGMPFNSPDWYKSDASVPAIEAEELPISVKNELPELVPRFCMVTMRDIQVKPSPLWLQIDLARVGLRSINNIVDYTNYYMLLTGQPLHAYDYDKVKALDGGDHASIVIRNPRTGEKIALLNGKEIEPRAEAIMIATQTTSIALGGIMGGADTEVDEHTTNIILEAASFDMYATRRTSMAHGLFSDAVTRFNKGQSPLQNRAVLAKIVDEIRTFAAGKVASELVDCNQLAAEVIERNALYAPVIVSAGFINARLGTLLTVTEMKNLLSNVEFSVSIADDDLTITAPFWRTDIEIPEDIVEEVGRLYGYDKLPLELPSRSIMPTKKDAMMDLKSALRTSLSDAGANELLTYSFVHGKLLQKVGQEPDQAFKLSNALSPELQYYRLSITPSLLDKVHANIKAGFDTFALFEIGKAHVKGSLNDEGLPAEFERLALIVAADNKVAREFSGSPYYQALAYLTQLLKTNNISDQVDLEPITGHEADTSTVYYQPGRSATIKIGGQVIGRIGEYKPSVRRSLKLPDYCAGFEIGLHVLAELSSTAKSYTPLSKFPKIEQDLCLKVPADTPYQQLLEVVSSELANIAPENTYSTISPIDIYQRQDTPEAKQITVRLSIASYDKTMRDSEVAELLAKVSEAASLQLSAERV